MEGLDRVPVVDAVLRLHRLEPIRDDEVEHAKHDIGAWYAKPIEPFHYCAPQYLSAGTSIAPIEWISRRVPLASMPFGMFKIFGASTVPIVISFVVFGLPHPMAWTLPQQLRGATSGGDSQAGCGWVR